MAARWMGGATLSSILLYHYFLFICMLIKSAHPAALYATIVLGLASTVMFTLTRSKSILLNAVLWLYQLAYAAETNMLIARLHPNAHSPRVYLAILILGCCDLLRISAVKKLRGNFISPERLRWYKDVIRLERLFITARTGCCRMGDQGLVEHIRSSTRRLDPRLYFCLLCDDSESNALAMSFEVLDIVREQLRRRSNYAYAGSSRNNSSRDRRSSTDRLDIHEYSIAGTEEDADPIHHRNNGAIELKNITADDIRCLTTAGEFMKIHKNEKNGCFRIEFEEFQRLKKLERVPLRGQISHASLAERLSSGDAASCLRILTQNFDASLTFADFEGNLRQINNLRGNFISTLINNQRTIGILDRTLLGIESFVFAMTALLLFDVGNLVRSVVPPLAIFIFPIAWNLLNSFMFIIYSHPYDIGDRVHIEEQNMIVKDIGLTSTTFERWNNECVVITNNYIRTRAITNIRRSKNQQWMISFYIPSRVDEGGLEKKGRISKVLRTIKANMRAFIDGNPAFEHISIVCDEIRDSRFYKICFIVKHAINHQNGFFMWKVQNKFMVRLVAELNSRKVVYSEPELNIE